MAQLRVGGPVLCRKQRPNPDFITGRPMIGTYQGLGMKSTVAEIRIGVQATGIRLGSGSGRKAKKLDPSNICHRVKRDDYYRGTMRQTYEAARKCSLLLDQTDPTRDIHKVILGNWSRYIAILLDHKQYGHLRAIVKMETARGQTRTARAYKAHQQKI